ncbi:MAG: hypothetical protein ACLU30_18175 [Odoribacter splanchnicus]
MVDTASAGLKDMMTYYDVNLMNPKVLAGIFIGSMMAFILWADDECGRACGTENGQRSETAIPRN